ncbi:DNA mismatch repair protein [Babesia ovis]|uniref:DNA mismatch repair protein n=1 Tax=Babesia ovis TaxID=5869 RepID=A0A9W5WWF9_BABOV|nr:DNA mismatch repair protein [Babesia ovis]
MAYTEPISTSDNLFGDEDDLIYDDTRNEGEPISYRQSSGFTKQGSGLDRQKSSNKIQIDDIEAWLMTNLKEVIPEDMQSMYINKNNVLFSFEKDPLTNTEVDATTDWLNKLTNGTRRSILNSFDISTPYTKIANNRLEESRKRVALDYKTDPSFIRAIDQRTGKYILSNLVRSAVEQRDGLINYVEYVRNNIALVPLLEELNRYAYTQKIAYRTARKQLWFLLKLADELKLVQKTKSFSFKIIIGKNNSNEHNPFMLDKFVTAKWLHGNDERTVMTEGSISFTTKDPNTSSNPPESFFNDGIMAEDSVLNVSLGDSNQPFSESKLMNMFQDSSIFSNSQMSSNIGIADSTGFMADYSADVSFLNAPLLDVSTSGYMKSFKGSISGNSWQMLQQLKQKRIKPVERKDADTVQMVLNKIDSKRTSNEVKNANNTIAVLEAACKLYGTGPKWCNPDKNEFDAGNRRNALVYIRPPKTVNQNSIAYEYLLQYKSVHQKLNGGIRQQHALAYGIITLNVPTPGEPPTSYQVNPQPWHNPDYATKWRRLGSHVAKSPWLITAHQEGTKANANEGISKVVYTFNDDQKNSEPVVGSSTVSEEATNVDQSTCIEPQEPSLNDVVKPQENGTRAEEFLKQNYDLKPNDPSDIAESVTMVNVVTKENNGVSDREEQIVHNNISISDDIIPASVEAPKSLGVPVADDDLNVATSDLAQNTTNGDVTPSENARPIHGKEQSVSREEIPQPLPLVDNSGGQMKLTALFRYVYEKMKKVKPLPEYSPTLLQTSTKEGENRQEETLDFTMRMPGKRRRILDDNVAETINLNYAPINAESTSSNDPSIDDDTIGEEYNGTEDKRDVVNETAPTSASKMLRKEKIRKMRELVKNMFEIEAEESDDENLSDPEDIRKKLQLLKQRLQDSSEEAESDSDDEAYLADEMKDFITEVENLNAEDEELAKQRFFADMKQQEDRELAKLMPLKERSERELTRREERMKLLMKLKRAKDLRDIEELHPSDFESSDEDGDSNTVKAKKRTRVTKEELEQLLKFKAGIYQPEESISQTEELKIFVDSKLQRSHKHNDDLPLIRNQVERVHNNRRDTMDTMLASGIHSNIFGGSKEKPVGNPRSFGLNSQPIVSTTENTTAQTQRKQPTIVMKSFRLDQASMKPLNSTNIRNVGGFTGFHNLENALKDGQNRNSHYASNKGNGLNKTRQKSAIKQLGIAICNVLDSSFHVVEISDNEFFTVLESIILQVAPTVCTLYTTKDAVDIKRIKHILSLCNVECLKHTTANPNDSITAAEEMRIKGNLEYLLEKEDHLRNHSKLFSLQLAMRALLDVFDTFDFAKQAACKQKFRLEHYQVDNYLSMDRAAFASLSILPNGSNCISETSSTSLFGILNKCRTSIGARRLRMWVSQPLTDIQEISKRHDCVEAFKGNIYKTMQAECLRKVPDLDAIVMKFRTVEGVGDWGSKQKSTITFEDLIHLYECIIAVNRMVQFLLVPYDGKHADTIKHMFTEPLLNISSLFESYLRLVEKTVDLKEAEKRNYVINRNFDKTLVTMGNKLDIIRDDIESLRGSLEDEIFYGSKKGKRGNNLKLVECNNMGFLFRVSKKDQALVQQAEGIGKTMEKVRLNKSEFLFTTPQLRQLCTKFSSAQREYERAQSTLVNKAFKVAATYWVLIERFTNIIATLDILAGFAEVAATLQYVRPEIDRDNNEINLVGARHPLVECGLTTCAFVPNNLLMKRETSLVHITTGPNMGGKSTYIRQVGIIAVMNQIGSFVPCTRAKLPIFNHVLCRVGASDIQLRGVSTFLAEMVEAAAILKTANERSLVIIDELGRGTSTYDGFGLAWAIIVDLIKNAKCFCLCATHFHEMGELAKEYPCVENKYVSAKYFEDTKKMVFLYEIKDGICRDSYAINVADIALFPSDIFKVYPYVGKMAGNLLKIFLGIVTVALFNGQASADLGHNRLGQVVDRITSYHPKDCHFNYNSAVNHVINNGLAMPEDLAQILGKLKSGKIPDAHIWHVARRFADIVTEARLGKMGGKPQSAVAWKEYNKGLVYHIYDALTLPSVLELV